MVMTSAHVQPADEEFMTPVEARKALGVSVRTLWRYRADGLLTPSHFTPKGHARYRRSDIERMRTERVA